MAGKRCCKCYGKGQWRRGAWGTSCYDNPLNCCGLSSRTKKRYIRENENIKQCFIERRKRNFKNNTRRKIKKFSKKIRSMTKKLQNIFR